MIDKREAVGMLVAEQPLRAAVFDRFGIDFCCGGKQTLAEACASKMLDPEEVLISLGENDRSAVESSSEIWLNASLSELIDNIQHTHHAYLRTELPRLLELAKKVARVHGAREPKLLQVESVFADLKAEIEAHTDKEDVVLFPYIRSLEESNQWQVPSFRTVQNPVRCMEADHDQAGAALFQLRELTDNYTPPEGACASWQALLGGLAHLDQDLRTHIHKENSILFPKAIAREMSF